GAHGDDGELLRLQDRGARDQHRLHPDQRAGLAPVAAPAPGRVLLVRVALSLLLGEAQRAHRGLDRIDAARRAPRRPRPPFEPGYPSRRPTRLRAALPADAALRARLEEAAEVVALRATAAERGRCRTRPYERSVRPFVFWHELTAARPP